MRESKHTAGPWRVAAPPDKVCTDYRDIDGSMLDSNWAHGGHAKTIVRCDSRTWMADGEEFANARLIAAAPELLAALKGFIAVTTDASGVYEYKPGEHTPWDEFPEVEAAIAAIAKAEGHQ